MITYEYAIICDYNIYIYDGDDDDDDDDCDWLWLTVINHDIHIQDLWHVFLNHKTW
jgi:hypothetical protein